MRSSFFGGICCCAALSFLCGIAWHPTARAVAEGEAPAAAADNPELAKIVEEDQADRKPAEGEEIDWKVVLPRDQKREARVKEIYNAKELRTAADYERAALVLQHASKPEDYLLAHEFCIVALAKGSRGMARQLAALTEDRFLMNIGRPQRFGSQFRASGPKAPVKLYEVGPGVTDDLRREFGVPSLQKAREQEAKYAAEFAKAKRDQE
jgi:hypothetical protein